MCRELFGFLLTLATRPFSDGNDIALLENKRVTNTLVSKLEKSPRRLLSDRHLRLIRSILNLADTIPIQSVAGTITGALSDLLSGLSADYLGLSVQYNEKLPSIKEINRIVISIGPTIGVGDEILIAKALVERIQADDIAVYVETRRFGIWEWQHKRFTFIGEPPLSCIEYIDSLSSDSRRKTGYIYADFLKSDPTQAPFVVPKDIAFSGRWIFGNASGVAVYPDKKAAYEFKYPDTMPLNRNIECSWIVSKFIPCMDTNGFCSEYTPPVRTYVRDKSVLVQVLTSKPRLILPGSFYKKCFEEVLRLTTKDMRIKVLAGPTDQSKKITSSIYKSLLEIMPSSRLMFLEISNLAGIIDELDNASLLFGPDTFTGHSAAIKGLPQVTIHLPEHWPWLNSLTPSFYIPLQQDMDKVAEIAAKRIAFILEKFPFKGDVINEISETASEWRVLFRQINTFIKKYIYGSNTLDLREVNDLIKRICGIAENVHSRIETAEFINPHNYQSLLNFSLINQDYDTAMSTLIDWYHSLGSSDLSGIFYSMERVCTKR